MTFVGWYRKEPPGVPTTSDHKFGTGEGVLVYQTRRCDRLVLEQGFWCTKRNEVADRYREMGLSVPIFLPPAFLEAGNSSSALP